MDAEMIEKVARAIHGVDDMDYTKWKRLHDDVREHYRRMARAAIAALAATQQAAQVPESRAAKEQREWFESKGRHYAAAQAQGRSMTAWQDIDTAPKDGTKVLVFSPVDGILSSHYEDSVWQNLPWRPAAKAGVALPTHWMPLPPPPSA